jgi:hypothetical protein
LVFTEQGGIFIAFRIERGRRGQWLFCHAHDAYNKICNCGIDSSDGDNTLHEKVTHWIDLEGASPGIKEINEEHHKESQKNNST